MGMSVKVERAPPPSSMGVRVGYLTLFHSLKTDSYEQFSSLRGLYRLERWGMGGGAQILVRSPDPHRTAQHQNGAGICSAEKVSRSRDPALISPSLSNAALDLGKWRGTVSASTF